MIKQTFSRIRRNHGLEHATLHLLGQRFPNVPIAGHSDSRGFWIMGNIPAEAVSTAAQDALQRLRSGQRQLAVHPNCGTNFATSGIFAGTAAWLAMVGGSARLRDRLERLPVAIVMATLALILSRPVGMLLQERLTTSGDPGKLQMVEVHTTRKLEAAAGSGPDSPDGRQNLMVHRITTRG
jgi:hypothetical protein